MVVTEGFGTVLGRGGQGQVRSHLAPGEGAEAANPDGPKDKGWPCDLLGDCQALGSQGPDPCPCFPLASVSSPVNRDVVTASVTR